jgi:RsiW-degrading membrane proteinase PrsW (M82 family)
VSWPTQANHPAFCVHCGSGLAVGANFCTACGGHVRPSPPRTDISGPPTPLGLDPLAGLGNRLRDVPFHALLPPLRGWWREDRAHGRWTFLFVVFAVVPFVLLQATGQDDDVRGLAWGYSLYFGAMWFAALHALARPERLRWWVLFAVVLFTASAGVALAITLEKRLDPHGDNLGQMILGVGLPEELAKGLAVYLLLFFRRPAWSTRTFVFAGVLSGLTFGTAEAVTYATLYESMAPYTTTSTYTVVALWRLVTDGVFHACMAGVFAFFIGLSAHHRRSGWTLIPAGLVFVASLHGMYDRYASSWAGTALAATVVLIFAGYLRRGDTVAVGYAVRRSRR